MASRRMIPTRFFKDPDILALSSKDTQLILIGLTLAADDEGREVAHAGLLGREMDYTPEHIERALQELEANDLLILYRVGKHRYYFLTRWNEWQTLGTKKRPSKYPAPPMQNTTDEERQALSPAFISEPDQFQGRPEYANIPPADSGKCRQLSSQENQRELKETEEEGEANINDWDQQKVILFPAPPAKAINTEKAQEPIPSATMAVQQVAQILKLEVSEALTRLVAEYARSSSLSLLGEADAAREWIDDGTRNRSGKRLTVAFFRRWLQREQDRIEQRRVPHEQQASHMIPLLATGTTGPMGTDLSIHGAVFQGGKQSLPSLMHLADADQQMKGAR